MRDKESDQVSAEIRDKSGAKKVLSLPLEVHSLTSLTHALVTLQQDVNQLLTSWVERDKEAKSGHSQDEHRQQQRRQEKEAPEDLELEEEGVEPSDQPVDFPQEPCPKKVKPSPEAIA